jgi:hypothetical protein
MARRLLPQRRTVLLARALHPHYRAVVHTYLRGLRDVEVREIPFGEDGRTDLEAMRGQLDAGTLCVVLGQPNVFGVVEDLAAAGSLVQASGGLLVSATTEAVALGLGRSPGAWRPHVAVGEGQSSAFQCRMAPRSASCRPRGARACDARADRRRDGRRRGRRATLTLTRAAHPARARDVEHLQTTRGSAPPR